ncbi:hypothetical protein LCGC14_3087560 [marine sediment metagenome]|uniref:Uncharacterized protein n=1 Tax=marine sediment metagenome TaxID=412755 RepID=A0A0F8WBD2_9ZZZZ
MTDLSRDEIESHSSALTNIRIANLMRMVSIAEMEANNAIPPSIQHAVSYHNALLTLFFETSEAYDTGVNKTLGLEIERCVKLGEGMSFIMKSDPTITQQHIELSLLNSKKLRYLMHRGLQNLKYFFRFGKHDPKGIKEILSLFEGSGKKAIDNKKPEEIENEKK